MWNVAPDQSLGADSTTFTALVHRVGCNNGVTGDVNDPTIDVDKDQVVITFTVSSGEPSSASCPGNAPVAHEVELPEALGDRRLVDGECAPIGPSEDAHCDPDGVRHTPEEPAARTNQS
ncbi:hypothetical protein [Kineococcus arenarius]|uniref:hypothetical protein n=1 Tax=Kineococcus sp. SYSU DK020 TaxID=3383141 RepID=UPI003D7E6566